MPGWPLVACCVHGWSKPSRPYAAGGAGGHEDHEQRVDTGAGAEQLMKVIEKMTMFDQHLTVEQRDRFTRRREQVGEPAWQDAIDAWAELIDAVRAEIEAGTRSRRLSGAAVDGPVERATAGVHRRRPRHARGRGSRLASHVGQHPDQLRGSSRVAPPEMWDYIQRAASAHGTG